MLHDYILGIYLIGSPLAQRNAPFYIRSELQVMKFPFRRRYRNADCLGKTVPKRENSIKINTQPQS
jgi:hypothetical protein